MADRDRYRIVPFVNPSGTVVHRVTGRKLDGTHIRENFRVFAKAIARKQQLELETLNIEKSVLLKATRLSDYQLEEAENAFGKLRDTGHSLEFAITWFLDHWRP